MRWRRIDLTRVIAERFGVDFHERHVGKLLKTLGFSHISARPRHPPQDERIVEAFKKWRQSGLAALAIRFYTAGKPLENGREAHPGETLRPA